MKMERNESVPRLMPTPFSASLTGAITTHSHVDQHSCLWAIINIRQYQFCKGIKRLVWQHGSRFTSAHVKWICLFILLVQSLSLE